MNPEAEDRELDALQLQLDFNPMNEIGLTNDLREKLRRRRVRV